MHDCRGAPPAGGQLRGISSLLRKLTRGALPFASLGALALAPVPAVSAASFGSVAGGGGAAGLVAAFKSMGLPGYLLLSLGINWIGWGFAAALKVGALYSLMLPPLC